MNDSLFKFMITLLYRSVDIDTPSKDTVNIR